jgi:hypothetical protein
MPRFPGDLADFFAEPLSVTACGLPTPLSVRVNVPVLAPAVVGSKNTPIAQLAPGPTLLPQALMDPKSEGLLATLVIVNDAVPLFVTVTLCGSPELPTY